MIASIHEGRKDINYEELHKKQKRIAKLIKKLIKTAKINIQVGDQSVTDCSLDGSGENALSAILFAKFVLAPFDDSEFDASKIIKWNDIFIWVYSDRGRFGWIVDKKTDKSGPPYC